jgi:hypothetical protein
MKIRTIVYIVAGALVLLLGLHLAFNTDWLALIKALHTPPKH